MNYETRILSKIALREGVGIFDESATRITIEDEAAGEFLKIEQPGNVIRIDPANGRKLEKQSTKWQASAVMKRIKLPEQADGGGGSYYHKWLKKQSHKVERKYVKKALKNGEQPATTYGKYFGWEL